MSRFFWARDEPSHIFASRARVEQALEPKNEPKNELKYEPRQKIATRVGRKIFFSTKPHFLN